MKRFILLFLTLLIVHFFSFLFAQNNNLGIHKVVIDPGHGGKDSGNLGTGRYSITEKDVVLDISLMLGNYIKREFPEIEVIYTRTDDNFVKLSDRTLIANQQKADLFISIHCDAFHDKSVHGTSTFVMGMHKNESNLNVAIRENSSILMENDYNLDYEGFNPAEPESYIALSMYQSNHILNSISFATKIQNQFKLKVSRKDRGVKQAGFMVISRAAMPSVLVELGFLTNKLEEDFLHSNDGKTYMASAIFRAFREYKIELESMLLERESKNSNLLDVVFSVQFLTSSEKLNYNIFAKEDKSLIKQFSDNGIYKYCYGNVKTLEEISFLKKKLINYGFEDCFSVAIVNGKKMSISKALSILN